MPTAKFVVDIPGIDDARAAALLHALTELDKHLHTYQSYRKTDRKNTAILTLSDEQAQQLIQVCQSYHIAPPTQLSEEVAKLITQIQQSDTGYVDGDVPTLLDIATLGPEEPVKAGPHRGIYARESVLRRSVTYKDGREGELYIHTAGYEEGYIFDVYWKRDMALRQYNLSHTIRMQRILDRKTLQSTVADALNFIHQLEEYGDAADKELAASLKNIIHPECARFVSAQMGYARDEPLEKREAETLFSIREQLSKLKMLQGLAEQPGFTER